MAERIVVGAHGRKYITTEPKLHQPQRDDTALLRQALEALEDAYNWRASTQQFQTAIAALKDRLK